MEYNLLTTYCMVLWQTISSVSAQTCYLACGDNCWSNGTCIKTGTTHCHSSCQHGCLSSRETDCCSNSCFSRCHGSLLNRTCQQYEGCPHFYTSNGDCVDKCQTSQLKYSIRSNELTPNSEAELMYRKTCFSSCPENFLEHNRTCVTECSEGFATTAEQPNKCSKCRGGYCYSYKSCHPKEDEDGNVLPDERGCTSIKGNVILWGDAVDTMYIRLISVREITGSLFIWMTRESDSTALNSLKNLRTVKGRDMLPESICRVFQGKQTCDEGRSFSLIMNLKGKMYTGLDNLKRVRSTAYVQTSTCHPRRANLLQSFGVTNPTGSLIDRHTCHDGSAEYVCAFQCYDDCTGPADHQCLGCPRGATDCRKCKNFLQGSRCVYKCNGEFYMKQNGSEQICADCHSECVDGCTGQGDTDCAICKNYRLRNHCIKECPPNTQVHEDSKTCLPCQSGCTQVVEVPRIYTLTIQVDPNGYLSWKLTLHNYCGSSCRADITGIRFVLSDSSGSNIYSRTLDKGATNSINLENKLKTNLREPSYRLRASTLYSYMVDVIAKTNDLRTKSIPTHFTLTGKKVVVAKSSIYIVVSEIIKVTVTFDAWVSTNLHIAPSKVGVTLIGEDLSRARDLTLSDQSEVIESIDEGSFRLRRVRYSVMIILPPKNFTNLVREEFLRYRVDFYDSTETVQQSEILLPSVPTTTTVPNGISASTKIIIVLGSVVLLFFIIMISAVVYKLKKSKIVGPETDYSRYVQGDNSGSSRYGPGLSSNVGNSVQQKQRKRESQSSFSQMKQRKRESQSSVSELKQRKRESQSSVYPVKESVYPKAGKSGYSLSLQQQGVYDSVYYETGNVYDQPTDYYGQYSTVDYSDVTPLPPQPPIPRRPSLPSQHKPITSGNTSRQPLVHRPLPNPISSRLLPEPSQPTSSSGPVSAANTSLNSQKNPKKHKLPKQSK